MKFLESSTQSILHRAMDFADLRGEVIANNIANVSTPGFKRTEVLFEDRMKQALEVKESKYGLAITHSQHMQIGEDSEVKEIQPEFRLIDQVSNRNDGNNVDIDLEMANSTQNNLYYEAANRSISNELKLLRLAITGRR